MKRLNSEPSFAPHLSLRSGEGLMSARSVGFTSRALLVLALSGALGYETQAQDLDKSPSSTIESREGDRNISAILNEVKALRKDLENQETNTNEIKLVQEISQAERAAEMELMLEAFRRLEGQLESIKSNQEDGAWDWIERFEFCMSIFLLSVAGFTLWKFALNKSRREYPILSVIFNAPCEFEDRQALEEVDPKDRLELLDPSSKEGPRDYTNALWTFLIELEELEDITSHDRNLLQKAITSRGKSKYWKDLPTPELKRLFGNARNCPDRKFDGDYTTAQWVEQRGRDFLPLEKDAAAILRRIISKSYGDDAKAKEQGRIKFDPHLDRRRLYISLRDDRKSERKHLRALMLPRDRFEYVPDLADLERLEKYWVRSDKFRRGRLVDLVLMKHAILQSEEHGRMDMQPFIWSHDISPKATPKNIAPEIEAD